jgi:hypothetical protein
VQGPVVCSIAKQAPRSARRHPSAAAGHICTPRQWRTWETDGALREPSLSTSASVRASSRASPLHRASPTMLALRSSSAQPRTCCAWLQPCQAGTPKLWYDSSRRTGQAGKLCLLERWRTRLS